MEFFFNKVAGLTKKGIRHSFVTAFFSNIFERILQLFLFLYQSPDTEQYSEKTFQKSENNSDRVLFFSEVAGFEVTEVRPS